MGTDQKTCDGFMLVSRMQTLLTPIIDVLKVFINRMNDSLSSIFMLSTRRRLVHWPAANKQTMSYFTYYTYIPLDLAVI